MENFQLRFPDVGEKIFKELDNESLTNFRIINKHWKNLLEENKCLWFRIIQNFMGDEEDGNMGCRISNGGTQNRKVFDKYILQINIIVFYELM